METNQLEKLETTPLDAIVTESGLVLNEAEEIKQSYLPFFAQLAEIKEQANKINFENPTELDEKIARELRLKTVKVRTGSEEVKNNRKRIHMLKAEVEQSSWNLIKSTCQLDEEKFAQVEKARERAEALRKATLKSERLELIKDLTDQPEIYPLGEMTEDSFNDLLNGFKLAKEAKLEAERKSEEERIAKEKAEADERERIRRENEKLKAENEAKEKLLKEQKEKADAELKKAEELRKAEQAKADAILENQRKASEEKAKKEKAIADAKLKEEREAKEKLEKELKAKQEADDRLKAEEQARIEAEQSKGDKEKLASLMQDLEMLKFKYKFTSAKYKKLQESVNELLDKTINYALSK